MVKSVMMFIANFLASLTVKEFWRIFRRFGGRIGQYLAMLWTRVWCLAFL